MFAGQGDRAVRYCKFQTSVRTFSDTRRGGTSFADSLAERTAARSAKANYRLDESLRVRSGAFDRGGGMSQKQNFRCAIAFCAEKIP